MLCKEAERFEGLVAAQAAMEEFLRSGVFAPIVDWQELGRLVHPTGGVVMRGQHLPMIELEPDVDGDIDRKLKLCGLRKYVRRVDESELPYVPGEDVTYACVEWHGGML